MNREFKAKSEGAVRIFSLLSKEAARRKRRLVFLGGSAIQQILKTPKRLSVDLDVFYGGEPSELLGTLEAKGYVITQSRVTNPLFLFYNMTKDDTIVKVQFIRETEKDVPSRLKRFREGGRTFMGYTPEPAYHMASKLAALALGTTGRKKEKEELLKKERAQTS